MAISAEYQRKIELIIEKLTKRMYKIYAEVGFEGFFTYDRLTLDVAHKRKRQALPSGLLWCRVQ